MNKLSILLTALLIIGCSERSEIKDIPYENTSKPEIFFCPQDSCSEHLSALISSSKTSVHCAFFELNLENVISALESKSKKADVKVVIDEQNYKSQIDKKIIKTDTKSQLSHNKFCVVDGSIVWTGSFNPTNNDNFNNNNNIVILKSRYLAANYESEFQELWNGRFGSGDRVKYPIMQLGNMTLENYFCPEDDCAGQAIKKILSAKKSIYFMAFSFTNEDIADALLFKGLKDTKGVFEKLQAGSEYSQYTRM